MSRLGDSRGSPEARRTFAWVLAHSSVDDVTLDVAAFEPLVGTHGGLGGWQDRAILHVPRVLAQVLPDEPIEGADRVHSLLVEILRAVGQRSTVPNPPAPPSSQDPNTSRRS
jgi:hypothetical protein